MTDKSLKKVLLIDDDASFRTALKAMLEKLDFQVIESDKGADAVDIIKSSEKDPAEPKIDLAILDVFLPDMRGDKICPELKKEFPGIKIILMSGYGMKDAGKVLDVSVDGFIQKPCTFASLTETLQSVIG